jgi:SAM-dependent methyltransferase
MTPDPSTGVDVRGISEALRTFTAEFPWERESILEFVRGVAADVPAGARVLDVGAGDAPYRELFAHTDYMTTDWAGSEHEGASAADIVASAEALPVEAASFDVALCTQVLEHVPDPAAVVTELRRVLRPGGSVHLTVPFVWEMHELPHDYFRYTGPGIGALLERAGFTNIDVAPRNDCFTTVAQLLRNLDSVMGRAPDGLDPVRDEVGIAMRKLADQIAELAPLDARRIMPLGYRASATAAPA